MKTLYIWILVFSLMSLPVEARIELSLFRPVEEFVTNNQELAIEGMVESSKLQRVAVSVNTPAGIRDLGSVNESLSSLNVDLGNSYSLSSLILSPVFEGDISMGPRLVNLAFSEDGRNFEDRGLFSCSSGLGEENGIAQTDFGITIRARYVQIDMLDGWQAERINISKVAFLDVSGNPLDARIRGLAIELPLDMDGKAYFQISILLREGENNINVIARSLDLIEEDSSLLKANYMPEVIISEEPLILSDGYKAELVIPPGALTSQIRKLSIQPLNTREIDWTSYAGNLQIAKNTSPVVAYNIEASVATPFPVTAKASLERQPPELAVDGNPRYPSTWITTVSPLPVWLKIDLREPRSIWKVIVTPRVEGNTSYGPKIISVMLSDDDLNYVESGRCDNCNDNQTEVTLPANSIARYIQIVIEEGKQGNNIQINEIELQDSDGTRIVSYVPLKAVTLARPVELTLLYDDFDLSLAGIRREENLAVFIWNQPMQEWTLIGGKVDTVNNWIIVNLNHLSTFAIFEAILPLEEVRWSYNPFSPNGDGIADTTTMSINLGEGTDEQARIEIYNCTGKLIRTLIYEEGISGHISIVWDGKDENGRLVSIGPYLYQVSVGKRVRNGVLIVAR